MLLSLSNANVVLVNPAELPRRGYPNGIYGPEDFDNVVREQDINPGDDPSWVTGPVLEMSEKIGRAHV